MCSLPEVNLVTYQVPTEQLHIIIIHVRSIAHSVITMHGSMDAILMLCLLNWSHGVLAGPQVG